MTRDDDHRAPGTPLRIGVLGAGGQLGRRLVREILAASDLSLAFAATRRDVDLGETDGAATWLDEREAAGAAGVDVVINAAAHTKVDACESEAARAYQVNALAPAEWARALAARGIRFIHVSTDYVFPGDGRRPYREEDPSDPRTVYGASKRAGEIAVLGSDPHALVARTSWVFGPGRNFVAAILEQARKRRTGEVEGPLRVVDDQRGSPTSAADLAKALLQIARRMDEGEPGLSGLLHLCNGGETTWFEFAREVLRLAGYEDVAIEPVPTSAFPTTATRPAYSVLDCGRARALGLELRPWPAALADHLAGPDRPDAVPSEAGQCAPASLSSMTASERRRAGAQEKRG